VKQDDAKAVININKERFMKFSPDEPQLYRTGVRPRRIDWEAPLHHLWSGSPGRARRALLEMHNLL
jgi:hypothetical protein